MATRLEGAGTIDPREGWATAAPAAIPATPRNSLREQRNFVIGATSKGLLREYDPESLPYQQNYLPQ